MLKKKIDQDKRRIVLGRFVLTYIWKDRGISRNNFQLSFSISFIFSAVFVVFCIFLHKKDGPSRLETDSE